MLKAIKQALGLAPKTMEIAVTIPSYDPKYRPVRHIKAGDRVIYRAGVNADLPHPLDEETGTVEYIGVPDKARVGDDGFYDVPVFVHFDDPSVRVPDAYGRHRSINSRNLVTLVDWLVERELKRAA
ncbi:hypothetical protein [Bosea sp. FBZP-16]|uniref:hypothetical protein n=1 Tax=Bosea sp. FBZP-16 TaxID=2065382 RepID=UPI000C3024D0|nr:hypothetical protein [Bosea sp. FBZP-16]